MANPTFTLYSTITVGGGNPTTITFTDIPQTGHDMLIMGTLQGSFTGDSVDTFLNRVNGNTASSNYFLGGDSSGGTGAGESQFVYFTTTPAGSNVRTPYQFYLTNYSSTAVNKQSTLRAWAFQNSTPSIKMMGSTYSTGAVTSYSITSSSGGFTANSKLSLYLIQKA